MAETTTSCTYCERPADPIYSARPDETDSDIEPICRPCARRFEAAFSDLWPMAAPDVDVVEWLSALANEHGASL